MSPGTLKERLEKERFDKYVRLLTEKANELDLYALSRGYNRYNWPDFVEQMATRYALSIPKQKRPDAV